MMKAILVLATVLLLATDAFAEIEGDVVDEKAKGIVGATISAADSKGNVVATAKSDDRGFFALKGLKRGKYQVTATAPGYKMEVYENVEVHSEQEGGKPDISNATRIQIILSAAGKTTPS